MAKKRGRIGRPPLAPGESKETVVALRVTPEHASWYDAIAAAAGYDDRSKWMRAVLDAEGERVLPKR